MSISSHHDPRLIHMLNTMAFRRFSTKFCVLLVVCIFEMFGGLNPVFMFGVFSAGSAIVCVLWAVIAGDRLISPHLSFYDEASWWLIGTAPIWHLAPGGPALPT